MKTQQGHNLRIVNFRQAKGEFKFYQGKWVLKKLPTKCVLNYEVQLKPDFFAPNFIIKDIQQRDMPKIMKQIKKHVSNIV